jgi:alkylation response protein AidB-like acyl-CoA dehydrogenase
MLSSSRSAAFRSILRMTKATTSRSRTITTYSQLPSEHQMIVDMCRKLADEEIAPKAKQWDKDHVFPTEVIHQLVRTCMLQIRQYGGVIALYT